MQYNENNNNFFSYDGVISRKNYIINMLILFALFIAISLVNFESFAPFITYKFLYIVLTFMVNMFKFTILMSAISIVYRRIKDFSINKTEKTKNILKKLFVIFFIFPVFYILCIRYFINIIPIVQAVCDLIIIYLIIPSAIISIIIISFIKRS